jgi:4-hydroxy-tetrahydrodipicolinate synthase
MKEFRGSYPVMITPFNEDGGAFDEAAMRRFVNWQIEQGSHGLIALGSMSEFFLIGAEERTRIVKTVVDAAAGRVPVLVGTMDAQTDNAVHHSVEAEALGADGLMITPPYYVAPNDDEIVAYYERICAAVSIPVMLYNNPTTTNVDMSAALVARLTREFDNVRYIKEACGELGRVYDIIRLAGPKMNVWQGARPYEAFLLGSNGWVSPEGNFLPGPCAKMYDLLFAGDLKGAEALRDKIFAINAAMNFGRPALRNRLGNTITFTKELCRLVGQPMGAPRPPVAPFVDRGKEGEAALARIKPMLEELGAMTADKAA